MHDVYALPDAPAQPSMHLEMLTQSELFAQTSSSLQHETLTQASQSFDATAPPQVELGRSVTPSTEVHALLARSSNGTIAIRIDEARARAAGARVLDMTPPLRTGP